MAVTLGVEHIPLFDKLREVLMTEPSPVKQQIAIELLTVHHCMRMGPNTRDHRLVADGLHKHVKQLMKDFSEPEK
jgi:hypothetical protein